MSVGSQWFKLYSNMFGSRRQENRYSARCWGCIGNSGGIGRVALAPRAEFRRETEIQSGKIVDKPILFAADCGGFSSGVARRVFEIKLSAVLCA